MRLLALEVQHLRICLRLVDALRFSKAVVHFRDRAGLSDLSYQALGSLGDGAKCRSGIWRFAFLSEHPDFGIPLLIAHGCKTPIF